MPINRLIHIIASVIAAAAVTVYAGTLLLTGTQMPPVMGFSILSVIALLAYLGWRAVARRTGN